MLSLVNQDNRTRWLMVNELDNDARTGRLYDSPLLTDEGREDYPSLLRYAVLNRDEEWLADELLNTEGLVALSEPVGMNGAIREIQPRAVRTLVTQEFNRLYCRAICRRAVEDGLRHVEVYRAEELPDALPVSENRVQETYDAGEMLRALRQCEGLEAALDLPNRPLSGLSLRLPPNAVS